MYTQFPFMTSSMFKQNLPKLIVGGTIPAWKIGIVHAMFMRIAANSYIAQLGYARNSSILKHSQP